MAESKGTAGTSAAFPIDLTDVDELCTMPNTQSLPYTGNDHEPQEGQIQRPIIVSIEGIAGTGKSELLEYLSSRYEDSPDVVVLQEPSAAWEQFSIEGRNLFDLSYYNPKQYGFIFQLVYFLALENQLHQVLRIHADKRVIICERSLLSARVVYTEMYTELDRIRHGVYQTLFQREGVDEVYPNHIILLDTEPRECIGRISRKDWRGEEVITLEYLQRCRRLHMEMKGRHSGHWTTIEGHPNQTVERAEMIMRVIDKIRPMNTDIDTHKDTRVKGTRIISIEGNIGAGKSTLLHEIEQACKNRKVEGVRVLREPVEEWERITDGSKTILELFYENPAEYGFPLQVLVGITTLRRLSRELLDYPDTELILSERSILSSKLVFAKMLHHDGFMDEMEEEVYQMIFDNMPTWLIPVVMLYLNTNVTTCLERIGNRNRRGENKITREQLERCEMYHRIMFEQTGIYIKTIDRDQERVGVTMDWVSIVIKCCRQVIQGRDLDHLEPFYEDTDPESRILPLVSQLREGQTKISTELYLIKAVYGDLSCRFALHDLKLTTKRVLWEIEKIWPLLRGQEIYLSWHLLERNLEGKCGDEDLNESLEYIENIDNRQVHRIIVLNIHLPNKEDPTGTHDLRETSGEVNGKTL